VRRFEPHASDPAWFFLEFIASASASWFKTGSSGAMVNG
jgi:hypothetical protein